ncbi:MAG: glycosyltransferase family 4 protein [Oscillospiraceae bacterium]|nr:glycosyltransferase family 4 protein [Oscillospiraceae bacterium]
MNIWIINQTATPPSYSGLVRHYYFSKYMQKLGHNVRIITSSKIHNTDVNMIQDKKLYIEKEVDGIEYTFVKALNYVSNGVKRILSMLQFANNAVKVSEQLISKGEVPDIIYASSPSPFSAYTAVKFAKKRNIKSIVEIRDLWPKSIVDYYNISDKHLTIILLYKLEKWLYINADKIVFTLPGGKDYILDKHWEDKVDLSKVHYVNNGVSLSEFNINKDKYKLEDDDLDDKDSYKVIYAGSIRKIYNLECIVNAAKICKDKNSNIKFLMYGDGTYREELLNKCKKEKLDNIIFKGRVDKKHVPYILSCADITLFHYLSTDILKYGGSPNKLFEYLASGSLVLSTVKMNYSIIEKYNCGVELEDQMPQTIAQAVIEMSKMTGDEYKVLSENAKKAVEEFDYEHLSQKVLGIIENTV